MAEYIKRDDAINGFVQMLKQPGDIYPTDITTMLQSIPSAAVRPVKSGRWIPHPDPNCKEWDVCTACGTGCKRREYGIYPDGTDYVIEENYPYCPHCGAKISGGDAE